MEAMREIEEWWSGEKGRWVQIDVDTGYGATCWCCKLGNVNEKIIVSGQECAFFADADGNTVHEGTDEKGNKLYMVYADEREDDRFEEGWPGLEKVLEIAIAKTKEVGI